MGSLHKFKLLATQCAVVGSPTRSPTTSPVIHLRRRRSTLRMLLSRGGVGCGGGRRLPPRREIGSQDPRGDGKSSEKGKEIVVSHKLKDLFVSSPPAFDERVSENMREGLLPSSSVNVVRSRRPLSAMFRQRLLRRAWRPVLVTIPE
ncbi:50S ribosomal protein-related [Abeliophyllum distichum]|uniref:50S ribosomal protein-related n=1 Tax=Abeliophyllum distichum TaxID=126358 RepID=A0ABD1V2S2_9LAMI